MKNEIMMQYRLWPFWNTPHELSKITNSIALAMTGHQGQARKYSGLPYVTHPLRVAMAVSSYPLAKLFWVCGSIMHDLMEDTEIRASQILEATDQETLSLVEELTNENHDKSIPRRRRKQMDWERLSKVSHAAKIIKLHDRIDNLKDMLNGPVSFKKLYCDESLQLLDVIGDVDKDIAFQLKTAVEYIYSWRTFPVSELGGKPKGTMMEHYKLGQCWIDERDGVKCIVFADGDMKYPSDDKIQGVIMRETGTSK